MGKQTSGNHVLEQHLGDHVGAAFETSRVYVILKERKGGLSKGGLSKSSDLSCHAQNIGVGEGVWGLCFELLPRVLLLRPPISVQDFCNAVFTRGVRISICYYNNLGIMCIISK